MTVLHNLSGGWGIRTAAFVLSLSGFWLRARTLTGTFPE